MYLATGLITFRSISVVLMTDQLDTSGELPEEKADLPAIETPLQRFVSEFAESNVAVGALIGLIVIIPAAVFAPLFVPQNPYDLAQVDVLDSRQPPGGKSSAGYTFWLGSDGAGRDACVARQSHRNDLSRSHDDTKSRSAR